MSNFYNGFKKVLLGRAEDFFKIEYTREDYVRNQDRIHMFEKHFNNEDKYILKIQKRIEKKEIYVKNYDTNEMETKKVEVVVFYVVARPKKAGE